MILPTGITPNMARYYTTLQHMTLCYLKQYEAQRRGHSKPPVFFMAYHTELELYRY